MIKHIKLILLLVLLVETTKMDNTKEITSNIIKKESTENNKSIFSDYIPSLMLLVIPAILMAIQEK